MIMSLCDWYAAREVLLTGVTSELGTLLLEKILRSFPDIKVYAVLRSRNGLNKDDRIKKIFASPGYERLRQQDPEAISRVKAFEGNLLYEALGLSSEDKATLKTVSVAFHASGPHDAVFEFCQELPQLRAIAATSSIFRHKGQITETLQNERIPEIPLALVRIPLLGPTLREPMPGFVQLLKGSTAFMVGAGYALGKQELQAEIIPGDVAVNTLVTSAWELGSRKKGGGPVVYNATTIGCTWEELIKKGKRAGRKYPYPTFAVRGMTSVGYLHWICVLMLEWLPFALCDAFLGLCGAKQRFLAEYERVRNALRSLESISSRSWSAERNCVYQLEQRLNAADRDAFPVTAEIDIESYVLCAAAAARKYCADETVLNITKMIRTTLLALFAGALLYFIFLVYQSRVK